MLVSHVLGDCPGRKGKDSFGNIAVRGNHVLRGCTSCKYTSEIWLPEVRKKMIYLDQFFFSSAFRGGEQHFLNAADRIRHVSNLQLLVAPFSSVQKDETYQWRGHEEDLMEFIKSVSRGHQFEPYYCVEETQVLRAFQTFLAGRPPGFTLLQRDVIDSNIHQWDGYYRIDVDRYIADIELKRRSKHESIEQLVDTFTAWRKSNNTFEENMAIEFRDAGRIYIESYLDFAARIARGDYDALVDSPIIVGVVQSMPHCLPEEAAPEERFRTIGRFFVSEHFTQVPCQQLSARIFAVLKDMVKRGAYTNRKKALQRLSGFLDDVQHISTYAPYCDAFVMDQPMAALVADPRVNLEELYGVRVFSLNNWDDFLAWLAGLEENLTEEHKAGLAAAYPRASGA
jgi:hypothetical protein